MCKRFITEQIAQDGIVTGYHVRGVGPLPKGRIARDILMKNYEYFIEKTGERINVELSTSIPWSDTNKLSALPICDITRKPRSIPA